MSDNEGPHAPDDCAFPLVETAVAIHMEATGSGAGMDLERLAALTLWAEGRIGEHWRTTRGPQWESFDNAVREMVRAACAESRAWLVRLGRPMP